MRGRGAFLVLVALALVGAFVAWKAWVPRPDERATAAAAPGKPVAPPAAPTLARVPAPETAAVAREEAKPILPSGLRLHGRVIDAKRRAPVAGASVVFRPAGVLPFDFGTPGGESRTDETGAFLLAPVPEGRLTLIVSAAGYAVSELGVSVPYDGSLEVVLSSGSSVAGHLVAADGVTPVDGEIELVQLETDIRRGTRTRAGGEFEIAHLGPGRYRLRGLADSGATAPEEIVVGTDEQVGGLVLALTSGLVIRGTVTGLEPEELHDVFVILRRTDGDLRRAQADERGRYEFRGVPRGRVSLVARSPARHMSKSAEVSADRDTVVDFDFPSGYTLSGRLLRAGEPVRSTSVTLRRAVGTPQTWSSASDANGRYVIATVPPGEYALLVNGRERMRVAIQASTVLDVELPQSFVTGRVLSRDGAALSDAHVDLVGTGVGAAASMRVSALTDSTGAFTLHDLQPGDYRLRAYKAAHALHEQAITFASSITGLTITLEEDPGVRIRVRDVDTNIGLRQLMVLGPSAAGPGSELGVILDESGAGSLPQALVGGRLTLISPGYVPYEIDAWDGRPLDLRFKPTDD